MNEQQQQLFQAVIIYYTVKCNAECTHCITFSSPHVDLKLPLETAQACLEDARRLGIGVYGITGGEPVLHYKEIRQLMETGKSLGMTAVMSTNGYWARNYNRGVEIVEELKSLGLSKLNLSADNFHTPFISLESVTNAIKAALAVGDLMVNVTSIVGRGDTEGMKVINEIKKYPVTLDIISPAPFGRGNCLPISLLMTEPTYKIMKKRCDQVAAPVVSPDGRVLTCCSYPVSLQLAPDSPFVLGNVHNESLYSILERNRDDAILRLLDREGPGALVYRCGEELEQAGYTVKDRYYGHCDLCVDLLATRRFVNIFRSGLSQTDA
jgi:MoaA/NifB/PqqE/SkfB family radical SAM enzyme